MFKQINKVIKTITRKMFWNVDFVRSHDTFISQRLYKLKKPVNATPTPKYIIPNYFKEYGKTTNPIPISYERIKKYAVKALFFCTFKFSSFGSITLSLYKAVASTAISVISSSSFDKRGSSKGSFSLYFSSWWKSS